MFSHALDGSGWLKLPLLLFVFACTNSKAHAQPTKETIEATIESKLKEIEAELKSIENHPWAGSYENVGRDEADVISIAPSGKIVTFTKYQGKGYNNCGTAKVVGQELQVKWDYDETSRACWLGDQLLVVPWGNATFLIERGTVHSFCLDYRNSDFRRNAPVRGNHVRVEGEIVLDGKPQLPDEFKMFWDLPPIECQITSTEKVVRKKGDFASDRKFTCTINKGSAAHIFVGMQMYASDKRSSWGFTVTSVEDQSATLETSLRRPFKEPRSGLNVTSNR